MPRLIDADVFEKKIKDKSAAIRFSIPFGDFDYGMMYAVKLLDAAPTVEPVRWISVKERLPEHGKDVLVSKGTEVYKAFWWNGENAFLASDNDNLDLSEATHWMPLPAAIKEANNE